MPKRELTEFEKWHIALIASHLEFQSIGALKGDGCAMLESSKRFLAYVELGHLVPILEKHEYDRVAGLVNAEPGRKVMPAECLACFAAVGMETK